MSDHEWLVGARERDAVHDHQGQRPARHVHALPHGHRDEQAALILRGGRATTPWCCPISSLPNVYQRDRTYSIASLVL